MSRLRLKYRKRAARPRATRKLAAEALECRQLLDGDGLLPVTDAALTVSFVPDGTDIAGESSQLYSRFRAIADDSVWQESIVQALQTWAIHVDGDIGVVPDSGDPFGVEGSTTNDPRFGDVRIGARPLADNVAAVSIPMTQVLGGSWGGDIVFNSEFDFQTADDILAVAMHEAGNVFGLPDSDDPNSPLYSGAIPAELTPTATDVEAIQSIHDLRDADLNERPRGPHPARTNDTFRLATHVESVVFQGLDGGAPSVIHGDISESDDVDFFRVVVPKTYVGPLAIQVRTQTFSSLRPIVEVYDFDQQLITAAAKTEFGNDDVSIDINVTGSEKLFVKVYGPDDIWGIGGYSIVASYTGRDLVSADQVSQLITAEYRSFDRDDMADLITGVDPFDDDADNDDDVLSSMQLEFKENGKYEIAASIDHPEDVDFYGIESPKLVDPTDTHTMTVVVNSRDLGGLIPQVTLLRQDGDDETEDESSNPATAEIPATVLANGGGLTILQWANVPAKKDLFLAVSAAETSLFNTGNYDITIGFGAATTDLGTMVTGTLSGAVNQLKHTLFVGRPQLFHFVMDATGSQTSRRSLIHTSIKTDGEERFDVVTPIGEIRSGNGVLLMPGEYQVTFTATTADRQPLDAAVDFTLHGTTISDPLAIEIDDPLQQPFVCPAPGGVNAFCYPGGDGVTTDPFTWDNHWTTTTQQLDIDALTLSTWIEADWWNWYWSSDETGEVPIASPDSYQLNSNAPLSVNTQYGLLNNDVDPEGGTIVVVLLSAPAHGAVDVAIDGSFTYMPHEGFVGVDQFTYQASDFGGVSEERTVTIEVFAAGDLNQDHNVDVTDIDALAANLRANVNQSHFDLTGDGTVDLDDHRFLITSILATSVGDANLDGLVDTADYAAWNINLFTAGTGWSTGDFNADGVTDVSDLNLWNTNRFVSALAPLTKTNRTPRAAASIHRAAIREVSGYSPLPLVSRSSQLLPKNVDAIVRDIDAILADRSIVQFADGEFRKTNQRVHQAIRLRRDIAANETTPIEVNVDEIRRLGELDSNDSQI